MAAFDWNVLQGEVHSRLRSQIAQLRTVETCNALMDALTRKRNVPAAYTLAAKGTSKGRIIVGKKSQLIDVRLSIVVVTQDFASPAAGQNDNNAIRKLVGIAMAGFRPTQVLRDFTFVSEEFFANPLARVAYEMIFETSAVNDFT